MHAWCLIDDVNPSRSLMRGKNDSLRVHIAMCQRVLRDADALVSQVEYPPPAVARYCKREGYG